MNAQTPAPGTIIAGKYRVERALGEGGMGFVLEATHIALGQSVAIKMLRGDVAQSPEVVARFIREAQIAAQLPPEHIARVTDVGRTERGEPYLVMELLTGRDLAAELWVRGPLPVVEAVEIVLQACEGVAEAHAAGLVHRDLKPANLFIAARRGGEPSVVKVLDFGLSKAFDNLSDHALTQTTSNFGTPAYMSPEQIRSAKYVDPRSDQHALGMILFELLTGHAPYTAESLTGLAVVISTEPPPHARAERREVPEGLDAAICKALAKRQPDRYANLAGFALAIAPFGGPKARGSAERIAAVLDPNARNSMEPGSISGRISGFDMNAIRAPQHNTHSPTTSDPSRKMASRAAPIAAAVFGLVVLAVGAVLIVRRPASDPLVQPVQAEGTSAAAPATGGDPGSGVVVNPVMSAAALTSTSTAPSPVAPDLQASSAPAEKPASAASDASSTAPKPSSKPYAGTRPPAAVTTAKPAGRTPKRPRDVFGGDK